MIVIFFGLAGAGKTYCAKLFAKKFGYHFYDGDEDLPEEMKQALSTSSQISDEMRDSFFENLLQSVSVLEKKYSRLVVAQTFIKEKYRLLFEYKFVNTRFILVETDKDVRLKRLSKRPIMKLEKAYLEKMDILFEKPSIPYDILKNNTDGDKEILRQFSTLFR